MSFKRLSGSMRGLLGGAGAFVAAMMFARPAEAAFHLWNIQELYTNSSGSLQFIEMFTNDFSQEFTAGQSITVSNVGGSQIHTFTFPSNTPAPTNNHALLLATAGIQAAGGPAPDFIIPNNFLFPGGGTISFFGANSGSYAALPTDGTFSRNFDFGTNSVNSPRNYLGATGLVTVPEPATLTLMGGLGLVGFLMRRPSSKHRTGGAV